MWFQDVAIDDKSSSVTVNVERNNSSCTAEASGSMMTVSSALSLNCSNSVMAPNSPKTESQFEISRSEPNSPSKTVFPITNNFVPTILCPASSGN